MTSAREICTVRCTDMIEVESRNDKHDREMPTYTSTNDLAHSLDDTTSSIISDSSEDSTTTDDNSKFLFIFCV